MTFSKRDKETFQIYEIAQRINKLSKDFDPYEHDDICCGDETSVFDETVSYLEKKDYRQIIKFLNDVMEECKDYDMDMYNEAKKIRNRICIVK